MREKENKGKWAHEKILNKMAEEDEEERNDIRIGLEKKGGREL